MTYADYGYYASVWRGSLSESEFEKYAPRAAAYIDRITFGRAAAGLAQWGDNLRCCSCALTELLAGTGAPGLSEPSGCTTQTIAAIRNDGFEVEYHKPESVGAGAAMATAAAAGLGTLWAAAQFWLGSTGLLYSGG